MGVRKIKLTPAAERHATKTIVVLQEIEVDRCAAQIRGGQQCSRSVENGGMHWDFGSGLIPLCGRHAVEGDDVWIVDPDASEEEESDGPEVCA